MLKMLVKNHQLLREYVYEVYIHFFLLKSAATHKYIFDDF